MNISQKMDGMQAKLLEMQSKLEEEDKDPKKKALNEEAVKQAAIEFSVIQGGLE